MLTVDTPKAMRLDPARWQLAVDMARVWCQQGLVPSVGMIVGRSSTTTEAYRFGRQRVDSNSPPIRDDAIFLIASITKPIVATGVQLLIERGQLSLDDFAKNIVPEFNGEGTAEITVRHLMTHTSGLPDMLPNNRELRIANAPLSVFIENICRLKTDFQPGHGVQYQSMGIAMLGEIVRRISGKTISQFLDEELFKPLEMHDTALGTPDEWYNGSSPKVDRVTEIALPKSQKPKDNWHWNSRYWRSFGAPWGGLLTTPNDLAKFAQMMLQEGRVGKTQILSKASVEAATCNQLAQMPDVPEVERRCRGWGLGWRLFWPEQSGHFGNLLGPRAYGHSGATGTVLWIDPDRDAFAIVLTTQPKDPLNLYRNRLSNAIAASLR